MEEQIKNLCNYLLEKNFFDIEVYDLSKEGNSFDYAIVATCDSVLNNKANARIIMSDFEMEQLPEGFNKGEWIAFDFDKVILHLFVAQTREKYNLDKLWQLNKMKS